MLMEVEQCGRGDVISFINNGRGFAIHKPGKTGTLMNTYTRGGLHWTADLPTKFSLHSYRHILQGNCTTILSTLSLELLQATIEPLWV